MYFDSCKLIMKWYNFFKYICKWILMEQWILNILAHFKCKPKFCENLWKLMKCDALCMQLERSLFEIKSHYK